MSLTDLVTGSDTGLTSEGITKAVSRYCEFDAPLRETRARSRNAVEKIVQRLQVRGKASTDELLMYFPEDGIHVPEQRRYAEHSGEKWWSDVAEPNLKALPCIKHKRGKWAFSGVDSSEFDDEHTRPVSEIRDDPLLEAEQVLDDLGFNRDERDRDSLLAFYSALVEQETATSDELNRAARGSLEELDGTFADLPDVERTEEHPPAPEEIEVETYADVLEAQELVSEPATVEWHYTED